MKLQIFSLLTHLGVAAIAGVSVAGGVLAGDVLYITVGSVLGLLTAGLAGVFSAWKLNRALSSCESVISDYQSSEKQASGFDEFDALGRLIAKSALHWESIATATRDQAGDMHAIMSRLDRRGLGARQANVPSGRQFRDALNGLGHTMDRYLTQIEQGASEIEKLSKAITENAESEGNALVKTTTYLEQLSNTIDAVSSNVTATRSSMQQSSRSAHSALQMVNELTQGMRRVHADAQSCEKKLQSLCDPTRQVNAIVESIGDIAARTNLLALNASIESIRAGEHGRGFALVADEVRNLAEQAADATREISGLMESIQLATQESIRCIIREREQVEVEVEKAANTELTLRQIVEIGKDTRAIDTIAESSTQQLTLAQEVVFAVEQISTIAKTNRGNAESVSWTMKSVSNANPEFRSVVNRLRNPDAEIPSENVEPVAPIVAPVPAVAPELNPVG